WTCTRSQRSATAATERPPRSRLGLVAEVNETIAREIGDVIQSIDIRPDYDETQGLHNGPRIRGDVLDMLGDCLRCHRLAALVVQRRSRSKTGGDALCADSCDHRIDQVGGDSPGTWDEFQEERS